MDFSQTNWTLVGFPVMAVALSVFVYYACKRQWSWPALLIGAAHLPLAFMHAVAPFRGVLDPSYPGYGSGLIRATNSFDIFVFSSLMLIGATLCAVIAVQNRPGIRNAFIVAFDAMVLILLATPVIGQLLSGEFTNTRVEFGEYLQFGGFSAFLFEFSLIAVPFAAGLLWAWKKMNQESDQLSENNPVTY